MEFRLTYEGLLFSTQKDAVGGQVDARAEHKRHIRRRFHLQLREFWEISPYLKHGYPVTFDWTSSSNPKTAISHHEPLVDWLSLRFPRNGYRCIPLVRADLSLTCSLDILYLRPGRPGSVFASGDIDNKLKTLFDALRLPKGAQELVGYDHPAQDEDPFFCLLEDDALITRVSVETDVLLQPTGARPDPNDARLIIGVTIRPYNTDPSNQGFA